MPLSYGQMQADQQLAGMANLLNSDLGALLNRAQSEEMDEQIWSFSLTNFVLYTQAPYNIGTITVTPGSNIVVGSGTLWTSAFNGFQMRFGNSGMAIPVATVTDHTHLTLTFPWNGVPQAGISYTLQQSLYPVPNASEVTAVKNLVLLDKVSRETLNLEDPQRLSVGGNPCLAWAHAPYIVINNVSVLQIEMWPVPSAPVPYVVEYRAKATPMVLDTDMPQVPSAVLEAKAMMYGCLATYASNGASQWKALADFWQTAYLKEREDALYADGKRTKTQRPRNPTPPFGMDFLPGHDPY